MMSSSTFDPSPFRFPSNGHNQKVHMHMVDLMSSIICEGDTVSQELLDTVLVNLVPAHKVRWWSHSKLLKLRPISFSIPCNSMRPLQAMRGKAAYEVVHKHLWTSVPAASILMGFFRVGGKRIDGLHPQFSRYTLCFCSCCSCVICPLACCFIDHLFFLSL